MWVGIIQSVGSLNKIWALNTLTKTFTSLDVAGSYVDSSWSYDAVPGTGTLVKMSQISLPVSENLISHFSSARDSHLGSGILSKGIYLWIVAESIFVRGRRVLVFLLCHFSDATLHIFGLHLIYIAILGLFLFVLRHMNNL